MHLSNFSMIAGISAHNLGIAINAHGFEWDLHNHADFDGFDYATTITGSTLSLKWHIAERVIKWRDAGCQPGVPNYPANGFKLVFSNVDYLEVAPRDGAMPRDEDLGVSSVSYIEASDDLKGYIDSGAIPWCNPSEETLSYHMVFRFNGGQIIRVGAEKAEFLL